MSRTAASLLIVALLAGCSTLPRDGPSGRNVVQGASSPERAGDYALVDLDFALSEGLKAAPPPSFSTLALASSDAPTDVIGVGDTLAVSIFEPGGSLFGGGSQQRQPAPPSNSPWGNQRQAAPPGDPRVAAYANPQTQQRQGGGFMAGAMQTAMGVAGGMLIGNALGSMFSSGEAMAEDAVGAVEDQVPEDLPADDGGDFFGGDEEF